MALFRIAFISSFHARVSSIRVVHFVISSFRLALFRLFVISLGVLSLFRLFTWFYFVLAPRHNAWRKDETINTKWHKPATIVIEPIMDILQNHAYGCLLLHKVVLDDSMLVLNYNMLQVPDEIKSSVVNV